MLNKLDLLRGNDVVINEFFTVKNPTLEEIIEYGEEKYWQACALICSTPDDYKVTLNDELGLDYTQIEPFEFFSLIIPSLTPDRTKLIVEGIDFTKFEMGENKENGENLYFQQTEDGKIIVIDRAIFKLLIDAVCAICNREIKIQKPANEHTKKYLIDKERRRLQRLARRKKKDDDSIFIDMVSAMINSAGFKYDYDTVWSLHISTFFDAIKRLQKIKQYDNTMNGIYSGCISSKDISLEKISWLGKLSN